MELVKVVKDGAEIWINVSMSIAEEYLVRMVEKNTMKQEIVADATALGAGNEAKAELWCTASILMPAKLTLSPTGSRR